MYIKSNELNNKINTSESYSRDIFYKDNKVIIPYINLQVFENFHNLMEGDNIDFAYVILENVSKIICVSSINNNLFGLKELGVQETEFSDFFLIGGIENSINIEIKVYFDDCSLFLNEDYKISKKRWIPKDTPNFKKNLDTKVVDTFLNLNNKLFNETEKFEKLNLNDFDFDINNQRTLKIEWYEVNN